MMNIKTQADLVRMIERACTARPRATKRGVYRAKIFAGAGPGLGDEYDIQWAYPTIKSSLKFLVAVVFYHTAGILHLTFPGDKVKSAGSKEFLIKGFGPFSIKKMKKMYINTEYGTYNLTLEGEDVLIQFQFESKEGAK